MDGVALIFDNARGDLAKKINNGLHKKYKRDIGPTRTEFKEFNRNARNKLVWAYGNKTVFLVATREGRKSTILVYYASKERGKVLEQQHLNSDEGF